MQKNRIIVSFWGSEDGRSLGGLSVLVGIGIALKRVSILGDRKSVDTLALSRQFGIIIGRDETALRMPPNFSKIRGGRSRALGRCSPA